MQPETECAYNLSVTARSSHLSNSCELRMDFVMKLWTWWSGVFDGTLWMTSSGTFLNGWGQWR